MSTVRDSSARLFWLIVLSAILPPAAVWIEFGFFTSDMLWNTLLTILLPFIGFIHSVYLLTKARYENPERAEYEEFTGDAEHRAPHCSSEAVHHPGQANQQQQQQQTPQQQTPQQPPAPSSVPPAGVEQAPLDPPPYTDNGTTTLDNKIQRNS